jgi:phosphate transport system substrate-binding protein
MTMTRNGARFLILAAAALAMAVSAASCGKGGGPAPAAGGAQAPAKDVTLNGAGATFQFPLMSKWAAVYNGLDPRVKVNYQSIGSGGGIRQITARTVHFGSTDGPMTDAQLAEAGAPVLHVPVTLGAVAVAVNLPNLEKPLDLDGPVLADIFLGKVTKWNDPAIAATNKGATLPDQAITVVHRSDGSGTTYIFVDFLGKVSAEWKDRVGVATSVNWPAGLGGKGNEGVAGTVKQTPGAIGYVELTYALQNGIATARVKNPAGEFVAPSVEAVTAAAAGASATLPEDLRVSITNAAGAGAYPVSGFSWVLVHREQADCDVAKPLVNFLWWAVHAGQSFGPDLHYAPLPAEVVAKCEAKLKSVTCGGRPVL